MLLARQVDVELELVVEQGARELLLGLHPDDGQRDLRADARAREVLGCERRLADRHDADAPPRGEHPVHERNEEQARGEDGHADGRGHLTLELHEEPAVGGDRADAFPLEEARGVDEVVKEAFGATPDHEVRRGAAHPVIAHRKRERGRVAHLPRDPGELGVEHQNPHGEPVEILPPANAPAYSLSHTVSSWLFR